jgi:hypothetical protein
MQILGHSDVRITLQIYTNPMPEMELEALEKLAQSF